MNEEDATGDGGLVSKKDGSDLPLSETCLFGAFGGKRSEEFYQSLYQLGSIAEVLAITIRGTQPDNTMDADTMEEIQIALDNLGRKTAKLRSEHDSVARKSPAGGNDAP